MSDKTNPEPGERRSLPTLALTRAGGNTKPAPPEVYLLADHLDTVLAAAEDIVNAHLTWNSAQRAEQADIYQEKHTARDDIENIRKLENTIIIRVLKSRERAEDVARADKRFRQLAKLYVAGTAVLLDAVEECGDSTDSDFATADTVTAYLRSRGLVDPDAPAPAIGADLPVGEEFLIAKRIAAGPLMDLAAALLDALELHFDLFLDEDELAMAPQINRFEDNDTDVTTLADVPAPQNDALVAAINDVRGEAAAQSDATTAPEVWAKLGIAGSVLPPVIDPPVAEPLVQVSQTQVPQTEVALEEENASELTGSENSDAGDGLIPATGEDEDGLVALSVSDDTIETHDPTPTEIDLSQDEDDVPTEIVAFQSAPDTDDGLAPAADEDDGASAAKLNAVDAQQDTDYIVEVEQDEQAAAEQDGLDDSVSVIADATVLEADAHTSVDPEHQIEDTDNAAADETASADGIVITAANDDSDIDVDDDLDTQPSPDNGDDDVSLVADNMDAKPEPSEAVDAVTDATIEDVSVNAAPDLDGRESSDSAAPIEAALQADEDTNANAIDTDADADADADLTDKTKKKKSKSLLGRLSRLKS